MSDYISTHLKIPPVVLKKSNITFFRATLLKQNIIIYYTQLLFSSMSFELYYIGHYKINNKSFQMYNRQK